MSRVKIQPAAQTDAEKAAEWYEIQQSGLGIEFILEVDAAIARVADTPEIYAMQFLEARRVLLRRFPYAIYFTYQFDTIEIFAILHQKQETSKWQSRVS